MSNKRFKYQSHIGRARGLGSAKTGVHHFIWERATGLALVPLCLWFVYSLLSTLMDGNISTLINWIDSSIVAMLMFLLVTAGFLHSMFGMQVVLEDYIHKQPWSSFLQWTNKIIHIVLAVLCLMAIIKLHYMPSVLP